MDEWNKWLDGSKLQPCRVIPVDNPSALEVDVLDGAFLFRFRSMYIALNAKILFILMTARQIADCWTASYTKSFICKL